MAILVSAWLRAADTGAAMCVRQTSLEVRTCHFTSNVLGPNGAGIVYADGAVPALVRESAFSGGDAPHLFLNRTLMTLGRVQLTLLTPQK